MLQNSKLLLSALCGSFWSSKQFSIGFDLFFTRLRQDVLSGKFLASSCNSHFIDRNEIFFCQFQTKMLQKTWNPKTSSMWLIMRCMTVFFNNCPISFVWQKKSFPSNLSNLCDSHFPPYYGSFWPFPMNTRIAMNCPMWLILTFKTVFDRIWPISHSLGGGNLSWNF